MLELEVLGMFIVLFMGPLMVRDVIFPKFVEWVEED